MSTHDLTEAQRDGRACVKCGATEGSLRPTGERFEGVQLFACEVCELVEHATQAGFDIHIMWTAGRRVVRLEVVDFAEIFNRAQAADDLVKALRGLGLELK